MLFSGTHGTTRARFEKIDKLGFKISEGRRGTGVYFWSDSPFSFRLSLAWWKQCSDEGRYKGDNDKRCAIIFAKVNTNNENEHLNLDDDRIKKNVFQLIQKNKKIELTKRQMCSLYDVIVRRYENKGRVKLKVLKAFVPPPNIRELKYPTATVGNPACFIARALDCIDIYDVKEIKFNNNLFEGK